MPLLMDHPGLVIAGIVALGAVAQWLAWRINLPAILPLLLTGFLLGPVLGLVAPVELIGENVLFPAVSLAVGLILFEGGLTLRRQELREIGAVVRRLVTIGGLVTWLIIALAAWLILDMDLQLAVLLGSLLMVTGPTVIGPLLRIVRPVPRVGNTLRWEGIVIDPIGAMIAALVFTFIINLEGGNAFGQVLLTFALFIVVGSIVGVVAGYGLAVILKRRYIPDFLVNMIALAFVFGAFALSDLLAAESGLLATTIMGIIIANSSIPNFRSILSFKEDLTVLIISVLFITLAANIELETLLSVLNWQGVALLAVIMLVARPATIFLSTMGNTRFTLNEKLYLSWIAPRGIVAASVSSLFAARLIDAGVEGAEVLVPLVFMVIVGTVLLNSITALPLARRLGVAEPDPQGFLILGAHPFARAVARYIRQAGFDVLVSDTNWNNVAAARADGLEAYYGSLLADQADDRMRLSGLGNLLALTSNEEANALTALKFGRVFGTNNVFQLAPHHRSGTRGNLGQNVGGRWLFHGQPNFHELRHMLEAGATIEETEVGEDFDLNAQIELHDGQFVPLFVRSGGQLQPFTGDNGPPEAGTILVSLRSG